MKISLQSERLRPTTHRWRGTPRSSSVARAAPLRTTGVEVFFAADTFLGIDDFYPIVYRVDRGEPVRDRWSASTNNRAAFIPPGKEVEFLSAVMSGSELIFRITAYSQDYTFTVPIHGLNDALYALGCYKGPPLQ